MSSVKLMVESYIVAGESANTRWSVSEEGVGMPMIPRNLGLGAILVLTSSFRRGFGILRLCSIERCNQDTPRLA